MGKHVVHVAVLLAKALRGPMERFIVLIVITRYGENGLGNNRYAMA